MAVMSFEYVNVDGINIRYKVEGYGLPVLLIHGLGEFLEIWDKNISFLSRYLRVYALDLPGHGLSGKPSKDYSLDFFLSTILHFMEKMDIQRAHLIGHSAGAVLCLQIAIKFPDKVEKMVLVDSGGLIKGVPLGYRLTVIPVLGEILLGPPQLINKTTVKMGLKMKRYFFNPEIVDDEWIETVCRSLKRPERKETIIRLVKSNLNSSRSSLDIFQSDKLSTVKAQTLVIHGDKDRVVPLNRVIEAYKRIPGAKIEIFNECGHLPQMEKAEQFNQLVVSFLGATESVKAE